MYIRLCLGTIGFLLFMTLAVLFAANGVREIAKGIKTTDRHSLAGLRMYATAAVHFATAAAAVVAGFYLFMF